MSLYQSLSQTSDPLSSKKHHLSIEKPVENTSDATKASTSTFDGVKQLNYVHTKSTCHNESNKNNLTPSKCSNAQMVVTKCFRNPQVS